MAKLKTAYVCSSCGNQSAKWLGKCPQCGEWNSFHEEVTGNSQASSIPGLPSLAPTLLHEITPLDKERIILKDSELNRVLGDGLVPGSVILFTGEPGIGKSTLMLQIALQFPGKKVLYVSGEESPQQIKSRADRLKNANENVYILPETNVEAIVEHIQKTEPELLIIDSIQTLQTSKLDSAPGTISQIRECANDITVIAKRKSIPTFLIGHITKDGQIAGPKVLEHMVDVVLAFEGDRNHIYRIIRSSKNRFGPSNEMGIYQMEENGLKVVENPSSILLSQNEENLSGIAISASMEGIRPLLIETQALVSTAAYGTPQRSATGFDTKRLNMLLAVLEKRCGFKIQLKDVFLNITGGIKPEDTGIDLSIVAAILSSGIDIAIPSTSCFAGEIGLSGEIRAVRSIGARIKEAEKMGFNTIYLSKYNDEDSLKGKKIKIVRLAKAQDLVTHLFR
ncbi:MAG: DNA repair protein RadA [Bacteroidetes bacterium]|nr:DNA repair protein RadA [Bacteroidota bacterium]